MSVEQHVQVVAGEERAVKKLLTIAALGEAATGLVLLMYPSIVIRLLFGAAISGAGAIVSRIAGIALIGLGLACWPDRETSGGTQRAFLGMLSYNLLATFYLGYVAIANGSVGILLWPAIGAHAVMTTLLVRAWLKR